MTERLDDPQRADKPSETLLRRLAKYLRERAEPPICTTAIAGGAMQQPGFVMPIQQGEYTITVGGKDETMIEAAEALERCARSAVVASEPAAWIWHNETKTQWGASLRPNRPDNHERWYPVYATQSASERMNRAAFDAAFLRAIDRQEFMVPHTPGWKSLLELVWEEIHTTDRKATDV